MPYQIILVKHAGAWADGGADGRADAAGAVLTNRRKFFSALILAKIFVFAIAHAPATFAIGLGALETRSYLGEPLSLRVVINAAPDETIDASCFSIASSGRDVANAADSDIATLAIPTITRRDVRISVVETGSGRFLQLRGQIGQAGQGFNEPLAKLWLRVGCQGQAGITREYAVLLDPPPLNAPPVWANAANDLDEAKPAQSGTDPSASSTRAITAVRAGVPGVWKVYPGDTLAAIASGIYPNQRDKRFRRQYMAAMRALNPSLADQAGGAPLPTGVELKMPDLKALNVLRSSEIPSTEGSAKRAAADPTIDRKRQPKIAKGRNSNIDGTGIDRNTSIAAVAIGEPILQGVKKSDDPSAAQNAKQTKRQIDERVRAKAPGGSFQLRLSGAEIDLTRSQGVTEDARVQLREKQLLLDSDDQVAQLLSLKNTVRQLEVRLNAMQSQQASTMGAGSPAPILSASPAISTVSGVSPGAAQSMSTATSPSPDASGAPAGTVSPPAPTPLPPTLTLPSSNPNVANPAAKPSGNKATNAVPSWLDSAWFGVPMRWFSGGLLALAALVILFFAGRLLLVNNRERRLMSDDDVRVLAREAAMRLEEREAEHDATQNGAARDDEPNYAAPDLKALSEAHAAEQDDAMLRAIKQQRTGQFQASDFVLPNAESGFVALPEASGSISTTQNSPTGAVIGSVQAAAQYAPAAVPDLLLFDAEKFDAPLPAANPSATAAENSFTDFSTDFPIDLPTGSAASIQLGEPFDEDSNTLAARFDLDTSPTTMVDFLVGGDEGTDEERVRRLKYMYERYPELQSKTVSIDDADSVINAARLYYEESKTDSARDKACELLTFAVEERPQENSFWLALFEIYRLDRLAKDFAELASKFHVFFGSTEAWPKVRHIGHELDPANPLFAAGGTSSGIDRFDPLAENWLHAPIDSASDSLATEMRQSLLAAHGVAATEFAQIMSRLALLDQSSRGAAARSGVTVGTENSTKR